MNFSTFLKRSALVAVLGVSAACANAQTFAFEGLIYKASGSKLTVQKAGTKVTTGEAGPTEYTGDIVVPSSISYEGKNYTVSEFAGAAFKATAITSIVCPEGMVKLPKGAFQNCEQLTKVVLPSTLTTFSNMTFTGCTALKELTIPGNVTKLTTSDLNTPNLETLTLAEGDGDIEFPLGAFGDSKGASLKTVNIYRQINLEKNTAMAEKPFRGNTSIEKVVIGGKCLNLPASYFENATALKEVVIENQPTEFGTNLFASTAITEVTIPGSLATIPTSCFQSCKQLSKVTLNEGTTRIEGMAFYRSSVSSINFPTSLKSVGMMAFSGAKIAGEVSFQEGVTSVGDQAFANNVGVTAVNIPASLTSLGDGAFFGCSALSKYSVAADNTAYESDAASTMIYSKDGQTLIAFAPKCAATTLAGDFAIVNAYAAYGAAGVTSVNLPKVKSWGDYALYGTGIETMTLSGTVGRYVTANCKALKSLTVKGVEVPFGVGADDSALAEINLDNIITVVKQDAFKNCTSLKKIDLGSVLAIIEADAFTGCAVEELTVGAFYPAGMAEGVFTEANSNITLRVPIECVNTYKAAAGWKYLNVTGDANVACNGKDLGMPNGLYYGGTDGMLHCVYDKSEGEDTYDVGGASHTFQLAQFKNRIYGASAGKKFVYSATSGTEGDGKLFYISKVGGNVFQAVVLDNTGNNAYMDPFSVYVYGDLLYVNDRNVCIRKIPADAISLSQNYPSWMENNWMGYYNSGWSYGLIKSGWAITKSKNEVTGEDEPLYWLGVKYNGNGIYRFKEEHIGTAELPGVKPENHSFLTQAAPIFTTMYVDEVHNQLYIYIEKMGSETPEKVDGVAVPITRDNTKLQWGGVYRVDIDKLEANPEPKTLADLDAVLIDGSPVKYEGSGTNEHVGISQFSPDEKGEYLYWCYRAPTESEAIANEAQSFDDMSKGKYWWADRYDASNPLHQSGIKRIKLGEEKPVVEMVAPGVEGYGVVPVNFSGSERPSAGVESVVTDAPQADITIAGDLLTANSAAVVVVYDMNGTMVAYANLKAGESMSLAALGKGAYIATANNAVKKFLR